MPVSGSRPASPPAPRTRYVRQEAWDRASLARRFSAWLLDMAILLAVVLVIATALGLAQPRQGSWTDIDGTTTSATGTYLPTLWVESLLTVLSALYAIPLWRLARGTIGQRLLGLRVFGPEAPSALSWRRSAIRWLVLFGWTIPGLASTVPALTWIATLVFIAWFAELIVSVRRGGHGIGIQDRLAGSQVRRRQWYKVVAPRASADAAPPSTENSGPQPAPQPVASEAPQPAQPPETAAGAPTAASRGRRRSTRGRPAKD